MLTDFDYRIFQYINQLEGKGSFLNEFMRFFAEYAVYLFIIGLVLYWFIGRQRDRRMVIEVVFSGLLALSISKLISHFYYRARPFVDHDVFQAIAHHANASFPSDHATGTFVIATVIWMHRKRHGWLWLSLAAVVSFSRVWVGVHYPLDIVGGMINGILSAVLIHAVFSKFNRANQIVIKG
ncbi:undecaprenyl-diphosphatase [Paenibacillus castaneae]|uniref:undecaprenyl-diphosphatase n=1 Tax=Paenibacillus castaneae TaxID=474957 RepID=UPI000C9C9275|nr:undecaprenyl-diphosphatase [Paenibacillus castaneae]NIK75414.1 undecaprenyl-diphosphatase [Paenibacillus castaneae]